MTDALLTSNDPSFSIRIDPPSKFVEIHMKGFWGAAELARFNTTLRAMLPALPAGGCPIGEQVTLFDLTAYQVSSQEVVMGLAQMARWGDRITPDRRSAIFGASKAANAASGSQLRAV